MLHFPLWSRFVNLIINHMFPMFVVPAAWSGPHMWLFCGPSLDAGDGTGQSDWSSGTTTNIYVFITAQLLWSTWNTLIPSYCHIYCCCQFWKPLLWSGTRWSCCCDMLLWPFCRLWLAYIYLLVIFGTVVVIYCHILLCSFILWMMAIHMCNFLLWVPFFILEFWSAVHSNQLCEH